MKQKKKWTLGQMRFFMSISAAAALLLLPVAFTLESTFLLYAALGCFIFACFIWLFFYKCPHCKKRIGQSTRLRCPYCGEKL